MCVQWNTPDDGQRNCPKHVEIYFKTKSGKLVHRVGFIIRIYHDARSHKRQILPLTSRSWGFVPPTGSPIDLSLAATTLNKPIHVRHTQHEARVDLHTAGLLMCCRRVQPLPLCCITLLSQFFPSLKAPCRFTKLSYPQQFYWMGKTCDVYWEDAWVESRAVYRRCLWFYEYLPRK